MRVRAGVGATAGAWVDLAVAAVELHALHDLVVVVDLEGRAEVEEDLLLVLGHLAVDDLGQGEGAGAGSGLASGSAQGEAWASWVGAGARAFG